MGTLDSILNFLIPILVWAFLIWILYRIPIITDGVGKLRELISNRKTKMNDTGGGDFETTSLKSVYYE